MKKREMSYEDYGMTIEEVRQVKDFCRNSNEEEKILIKNALAELDPYIAPYVYYSLVNKMSYDEMYQKNIIYKSKVDFYADRRKGIESIKRWMILYGIWELS